MDSKFRQVIVDAGAAVSGRPLALERIYYGCILAAYAKSTRGAPRLIAVLPAHLHAAVESKLRDEGESGNVVLKEHYESASSDVRFGIEHIFDPRVVQEIARSESKPLPVPLWTIKNDSDIGRAAATLERLDIYPIARYLVIPSARRIAVALRPTKVTPNMVTATSCLLGVIAGPVAYQSGWQMRLAAALLIHFSIVLDFSDGYLARLRGSDSKIGYWLDTTLDEVVKGALLLSMSAIILRDGPAWAIASAIVVLILYHTLTCSHWLTQSLTAADVTTAAQGRAPRKVSGLLGVVRRFFNALSQLDIFLYMIALALLTSLEWLAMTLFALNYALRFVLILRARLTTGTF